MIFFMGLFGAAEIEPVCLLNQKNCHSLDDPFRAKSRAMPEIAQNEQDTKNAGLRLEGT